MATKRKRVRLIEIWKPVVGFEGYYEVSNKGNVRRTGSNQLRKLTERSDGYRSVPLCVEGVYYFRLAHVLVCEAFNGPRPTSKHEVNHENGHRADNWFENLTWMTRSQNMKHAFEVLGNSYKGKGKTGKFGVLSGCAKSYSFISPEGELIRVTGLREFCRKQNLNTTNMSRVFHGKRNSHKGWLSAKEV